MVQLNVLGLLYCAHAALPHLLRAAGDGPRQVADMVNISSVAGRAARNGNGVYSLTKHGVGAFSKSLRQKVARQLPTRLGRRAGRDRDGAGQPQPARGARKHSEPVRAADAGRGYRRRGHLHRYAAAACRGQRDSDSPTDSSGNRHRQVALRTSAPTCPVLRSVQVHTKQVQWNAPRPALHTSRSGDLVKPGSHSRSPCGR